MASSIVKKANCAESSSEEDSNKSEDDVPHSSIDHKVPPSLQPQKTLSTIFRHLSLSDRRQAAQMCLDLRDACNQPSLRRDRVLDATPQRRQVRNFEILSQECPPLRVTLTELADSLLNVKFERCYSIKTDDILQETIQTSGMPSMTHLSFRHCFYLRDDGVELISRLMPSLVSLDFGLCESLSDTALLYVALRLRKLTSLSLTQCQFFTDKGIGYLVGRNLDDVRALSQSLEHPECQVAADNLAMNQLLLQGSSIIDINLSDSSRTTDFVLQYLSEMPKLKRLRLSFYDQVNDSGMSHLAKMVNLRCLKLSYCVDISYSAQCHLRWMRQRLLEMKLQCSCVCPSVRNRSLTICQPTASCLDVKSCDTIGSEAMLFIADQLMRLRCKLVFTDNYFSESEEEIKITNINPTKIISL